MGLRGWQHKCDFWAFQTQQPGTIRIAVAEHGNPHCIMINHRDFTQDEGQSMTFMSGNINSTFGCFRLETTILMKPKAKKPI